MGNHPSCDANLTADLLVAKTSDIAASFSHVVQHVVGLEILARMDSLLCFLSVPLIFSGTSFKDCEKILFLKNPA